MSRDYTLLAKLGFADPDRQNPIHDAACRYLAQREVAFQLCALPIATLKDESFVLSKIAVEEPISKGGGQYKTTIGFMDVVYYSTQIAVDVESSRELPALGIGIKVKHTQKSIHDAIRQIKLYREYTDSPFGLVREGSRCHRTQYATRILAWFLVATFDVAQQEMQLLDENGIRFVRLGAGFDDYLKATSSTVLKPALIL